MNSVGGELVEYSKEHLFGLSDFHQQFCGQELKLEPIVE